MKSSYELAMERLAASDPDSVRELSDAQKAALGAVSDKYRAKRAEREVFLKGKIAAARISGDISELERIERQLRDELATLEEDEAREKDRIRNGEGV